MEIRLDATNGMTDEYYINLAQNGFKYRFVKHIEEGWRNPTDICYITVNTMDELMKLVSVTGGRIIVEDDAWGYDGRKPTIEIYDGYRE